MASRPAEGPPPVPTDDDHNNKRQKTGLSAGLNKKNHIHGDESSSSRGVSPVEKNLSVLDLSHSTSELGLGRKGTSSRESVEPTCKNGWRRGAKNFHTTSSSPPPKSLGDRLKHLEMKHCDDDEVNGFRENLHWGRNRGDIEVGESFFLRQPFTQEEFEQVAPKIRNRTQEPVHLLEEKGYEPYREWRDRSAKDDEAATNIERKRVEQALMDAKIEGAPRQYQQRLFEMACSRNTIVHLGTGAGKTLVALMCIRHFAAGLQEGKQTCFLVPSVALAIQQSTVLRANLPFSVEVASYATTLTPQSRQQLSNSEIIVATHGAIQDLFMHYGDLFSMDRINLLVIDECHNAIGSHCYATLMKRFYHTLPNSSRPRVLGLTASPLVKAKPTHTEENLAQMLMALEQTLDSEVVSHSSIGPDDENQSEEEFMRKAAEERTILYRTEAPNVLLPSFDKFQLHHSRKKEFQQLHKLYEELGPLAVSIYCQTLAKEVSRNTYERESGSEFKSLIEYLHSISSFCDQLCQECNRGGRSDKLLELEALLENQIEDNGGPETVGLVFVERRITAVALNDFFRFRNKNLECDNWGRATEAKEKQPKMRCGIPSQTHLLASPPESQDLSPGNSCGQFEDAEDDMDIEVKPVTDKFMDIEVQPSPSLAQGNLIETEDPFADADEDGDEFILRYFEDVRTGAISSEQEEGTCGHDKNASTQFRDSVDAFSCSTEEPSSGVSLADAEGLNEEGCVHNIEAAGGESIRCQALVRNATQIFKSLNMSRRNTRDDEAIQKSWLHQEYKIRDVLSGLRRGDINVLIATSVVEEGVDVQACSFVVVFDSLKSTKGYIQMKGRARQKDAKFFVFHNVSEGPKPVLSLKSAREIESRVSRFISSRAGISSLATPQLTVSTNHPMGDVEDDELRAAELGIYETKEKHGTVDLYSAKSLVNRYVLSLPIDPIARSSKSSLRAHLPTYSENQLCLPSHLPAPLRTVNLPERYHHLGIKEKQKILAMMACVRLHKHSLLNDRLLPLTRSDLQFKMLEVVTKKTRRIPVEKLAPRALRNLFVYPLLQENAKIHKLHKILRSQGHQLAVLSIRSLDEVPPMRVDHGQFGMVTCALGKPFTLECNDEELQIVMSFFKLMMDCRWKKQSKNVFFRPKGIEDFSQSIPPYFVGCLSKSGDLDWLQMKKLIAESRRSKAERYQAVQSSSDSEGLPMPRLYSPLYNPHFTYIAYGPSGETCAAKFITKKMRDEVITFQDYFSKCKEYYVEEDCPLIDAQRLWVLPFNKVSINLEEFDDGLNPLKPLAELRSKKYQVCEDLRSLLLPKSACVEVRMADPNFLLKCTFLPQFLYHMQPYVTATSFIKHCRQYMPQLGDCLSRLPIENVVEALTAKSCAEECSYEKLEWLGDAVLKLVQTDSLLRSKDMSQWVEYLHEGDLSTLRSIMGCNERLELACKHLGVDDFILASPLGRGEWTPESLELYEPSTMGIDDGKGEVVKNNVSGKTCADVVEALLGLIYLACGYEVATLVADELQVTLPREDEPRSKFKREIPPKSNLLEAATSFTGQKVFKRCELVEEAFTHPTAMHPVTPSYQRLEWVGDAVLCLAVREWIFNTFPGADVGQMVAMEASLVANETLAYLSIKHGLLKNLNHCDSSLPSRIETFEWCTKELGRGLWGTDPPKVAADLCESLIGAVYMDSGVVNGVKSVMFILRPLLRVLEQIYRKENEFIMMHPKKALQEIGGSLLVMKAVKEDYFASMSPETPVWLGRRWGRASANGNKYIGYVRCLNFIVVAVADLTSEVAGNRACAFAVSMLRNDPELLERMLNTRTMVESTSSRQMNWPEDQKIPDESSEDNKGGKTYEVTSSPR